MTLSIRLLDNDDSDRHAHDPTPEDIRQACWRIQRGWDRQTRRIRAGCFAESSPELAVVDVPLVANF